MGQLIRFPGPRAPSDPDDRTDGDQDDYVPVQEDLGFIPRPPRVTRPELVPPAAASRYVHPQKREGRFECKRCRRRVDVLVSVGESAERTVCAKCQGVLNARNNPRPPRRPYRGRR